MTTVIWTVTDNAGSTATCTQTVTVTDNVPPTITCPADVAVNTNSGCTATGVVLGTPVSSDNCGVASVPGRRCRQHQQWLYRYWCRLGTPGQ
ncbi:MAG: hypothetical protein IPH60_06090 [Flavobacteriales bacterium]|nr:hypothetical protein [Flavobacteriales bacterium]